MRARARRREGEEGSALIIALVFATIFSLFVATVVSFAEVGLRASASFDGQGRSAYAADGAVNAAINRFRGGGPCDNYTAPLGPDGKPLDGPGVIVRCVDDNRPASGRATKPVNALLSLGAEGISTSGGEQRVLGNIFSNSTVTAGATLVVQGQVSATGDCTGPIQTSPAVPLKCANNPDPSFRADPVQGRDPDYTKAIAAVPARQTAPACPAGWLVELEPGYYDDAATLTALTDGTCPGRVVWLKPGNYYLDFTFRGGAGTWTVNDPGVDVVAGTPRGWDPAAPARPTLSVPGSCRTDADPDPVDGVQLVAGGGTHLQITKGRFELCAEPATTDQSIALYGMAPDRPAHTLEPTDWSSVNGFVDPGDATTIGEAPVGAANATATLAAGASGSASLAVTAFRPGVPAGSLVDSATLRVSHREVGDMDDLSSSVRVAAAFPGSTCTGAQAVAVPVSLGAFAEHRIDLKAACGLTDPASFADLEVTYTAALRTGGTSAIADLDGIAVEVAYRTPTTAKPTVVTNVSTFTNEGNALEIGEQPAPLTADAALSPAGPSSAAITLAGLGEPPIPPGSTIDSAVLRVAHQEPAGVAPTVTVPFPGGSCDDLQLTVRAAAIVDDRVDLKACGLVSAADLVGLTATYEVALSTGGSATVNLDGMWLELVYSSPPLTRPPATATTTTPGFADPDDAKVIGEQPTPLTADAVLDATTSTASLTVGGYDQPPAVPPGSYIDSAVLRVAHHDVGPMGTPTLAVAFSGTNTCPTPALTKRDTALGEDRVDLRSCGLNDPAQLSGLSVTYTANFTPGAPTSATARVDGIVLDLAYRPPTTRRPTTATTTTPGFSDPDHAKAIGESPTPPTANVTLAQGAAPASVTVAGYDSAVPLPAGSVIDSAVLRVAHQDDAWMGPVTLTTTFPGSSCAAQTLPLAPGAIAVHRSSDLATCGLTRAEQLADLEATYTANAPTTANAAKVPSSTGAVSVFADPDKARAIDGVTADAALSTPGTMTASITLSGYDQAPPPPGSTISTAVLRVAHQEDAGVAPVSVTASRTGGPCVTQTLATRLALGEDTIDLSDCGITGPSQLADLTVTFGASLDGVATAATARLDGVVLDIAYQAPSATDRLDGIELDVVFRPPAFRSLDGCVTAGPYPGAGACALVRVAPDAGDTATRFVAQGSVYAPSGALDISMAGLEGQVLTRGLVARTIRLGLSAAPGYKRPLLGVPPEPVRFTAYPDVTARATAATATGFTNPDDARVVGERPTALTADVALSSGGPTSATLELGGYPTAALPTGAVIDAAVLRVAHREDADIGVVTVTIGGLSAGPCAQPFELSLYPSSGPFGEDQIDLTPCGLVDPSQLNGLTVSYTASLKLTGTAGTAYLDGITLDLLSGPLLRARVAYDATQDTVQVQGWSVLR